MKTTASIAAPRLARPHRAAGPLAIAHGSDLLMLAKPARPAPPKGPPDKEAHEQDREKRAAGKKRKPGLY